VGGLKGVRTKLTIIEEVVGRGWGERGEKVVVRGRVDTGARMATVKKVKDKMKKPF